MAEYDFDGRVAFVTGAARGQGRSHAHHYAENGADALGIWMDVADEAEVAEQSGPDNVLGEIVRPEDVSAAFMWLSSDDARFVTGIALPVAAGETAR